MLEDTGERVIPDNMKPSNLMLLEHLARYHFSKSFLKGRLLDIACGSGYGTQLVAKLGRKKLSEVVAADINPQAVKYASKRYHHPSIDFRVENAVDPELVNKIGTFDVILSFETYEHIKDEEAYFNNMYQLLNPEGVFVMSTPFGKGRGIPSGSSFHVHQITKEEFTHLFDAFDYQSVDYYFQSGVLIEPYRYNMHYPLGISVCKK